MQRCSKKAYAMCPTRHLCGQIEEATFTEDSECAAFNRAVEDKPMTNADRIRAMSDVELVRMLMGASGYPCDVKIPAGECDEKCENCIMDWLQQPAEGE